MNIFRRIYYKLFPAPVSTVAQPVGYKYTYVFGTKAAHAIRWTEIDAKDFYKRPSLQEQIDKIDDTMAVEDADNDTPLYVRVKKLEAEVKILFQQKQQIESILRDKLTFNPEQMYADFINKIAYISVPAKKAARRGTK